MRIQGSLPGAPHVLVCQAVQFLVNRIHQAFAQYLGIEVIPNFLSDSEMQHLLDLAADFASIYEPMFWLRKLRNAWDFGTPRYFKQVVLKQGADALQMASGSFNFCPCNKALLLLKSRSALPRRTGYLPLLVLESTSAPGWARTGGNWLSSVIPQRKMNCLLVLLVLRGLRC